jgi:hypothetical protein
MRGWVLGLTMALFLSACTSDAAVQDTEDVSTVPDVETSPEVSDAEDTTGPIDVQDASALSDADTGGPVDAVAAETGLVDAGAMLDSQVGFDAEVGDTEGDVDATEDAGPPLMNHFTLEVTKAGETETALDVSFPGFVVNMFGAEIFGHMLKIWAGDADTQIEILIRTDSATIPGSVQPGLPGSTAWIVMLMDDAAYSTQMTSGTLVIETCPSTVGTIVHGSIESVMLLDLGAMGTARIDGVFEVVLGAVSGEAICSGL